MTIGFAIAVAVLGAVVVVCCSGIVEVFRQLAEIRVALKLDDQANPLALKRSFDYADLALPTVVSDIPQAIAVVLSNKCVTCRLIAEAFQGGAPSSVWFILEAEDLESSPIAALLEASSSRVVLDREQTIASRLGLEVTPAVFGLEFGVVRRAFAVSSARQVMSLIPATLSVGRPENQSDEEVRPLSGKEALV